MFESIKHSFRIKKKPIDQLLYEFRGMQNPMYVSILRTDDEVKNAWKEEDLVCPYCGSKELTINEDGLWVCMRCGSVIRPAVLHELGIDAFEIAGESYSGSEKRRYTSDTYEHRDFFAVLDKLGFDYEEANRAKWHAWNWFVKVMKHAHRLKIPVPYVYGIAIAYTLEEFNRPVDYDRIIAALKRVRPWTITLLVGGGLGSNISAKKLEDYKKKVDKILKLKK